MFGRKFLLGLAAVICIFALWHFVLASQSLHVDAAAFNRLYQSLQVSTSDIAITRLRQDKHFLPVWPSDIGMARTTSESCDDWASPGPGWFICPIEAPEHTLVRDWIPQDAAVVEFGARFGTTSCEIARKIGNSGKLVSVEPDPVAFPFLEKNLQSHNCKVHALHGVFGDSPVQMTVGNYGIRTEAVTGSVAKGTSVIPNFHFDDVEAALGIKFDTLLIDCEGCAQFMMNEIGPKIKTQIKLVLLEGDMGNQGGDCQKDCMDYSKFIAFLEEHGFEMVDKFNDCDRARHGAPEGTWCGNWIEHYAFRRRHLH